MLENITSYFIRAPPASWHIIRLSPRIMAASLSLLIALCRVKGVAFTCFLRLFVSAWYRCWHMLHVSSWIGSIWERVSRFSDEDCPSGSEASSSVRFRSISKMLLGNVYTL